MNPKERNGARSSANFDETFKRHAVDLTLRGARTVKQVADELGITTWTLYRWRGLYAPRPAGSPAPRATTEAEKDDEIQRLRTENARLREREIVLKKSLGILSETPTSGMPRSTR